MPEPIQEIAIVGVGLIGGSFALAIRKAGFLGKITGVSSPAALQEALAIGAIDEGGSLEDSIPRADLVYLAQPITKILETLERLPSLLRQDALVTDAGSTKSMIVGKAAATVGNRRFVGGHPMAGKERRGVGESDAELFRDRTYFLAASRTTIEEEYRVKELVDWLERMGALPVSITAEDHDRLVGLTSHLVQLASTGLAGTLAKVLDEPLAAMAAGPGLLDMSRLAMSSHEIWRDILASNGEAIRRALSLYIEELQQMREAMGQGGLGAHFEIADQFAQALRKNRN